MILLTLNYTARWRSRFCSDKRAHGTHIIISGLSIICSRQLPVGVHLVQMGNWTVEFCTLQYLCMSFAIWCAMAHPQHTHTQTANDNMAIIPRLDKDEWCKMCCDTNLCWMHLRYFRSPTNSSATECCSFFLSYTYYFYFIFIFITRSKVVTK